MAFTLLAALPLAKTTTVLPNPQFGDSEAATGTLNVLRTVTGNRRTYVKSRDGRRKLNWSFTLTRNKALELFEFYRSYNASQVFIQDHNNRNWIGFFVNNPFEIEMSRRGLPSVQDWPVGETCDVTIEFEATLSSVDLTSSKILTESVTSELSINQNVFIEADLPTLGSLVHNWDALQIVHADETVINSWPDSGPAGNTLIGTIGNSFDQTIDRSPIYRETSGIFNFRPTVAFENVQNQFTSDVAAMQTTSDTNVFPSRRGSIFWVFAHTVGNTAYTNFLNTNRQSDLDQALANRTPITDATEYAVWSLQNNNTGGEVEQIHISGGSSQFFPIDARFLPADPLNNIRLVTSNTSPIPSVTPIVYTLVRDTNTNLRFRTNGIEREGATILNNPGYTGLFHMNDQSVIPQFDAKIRGEWGQCLIYNRRLTTSEINQVERYLSLRWGIPLGTAPF